jgi:DNA modification methylase
MNRLLFGDNLKWLRDAKLFPDASVDLVYLDPPFNSNADYNVLFREASGEASQAQFHAFTDTWNWADAAQTYAEFVDNCPNTAVVEMMEALHGFLKNSPMMAYLAMMAPRLVELHRVLKPTGSLYLHCDPTASHYLKMVLDGVFGPTNFRSEIIWKRKSSHNKLTQQYGPIHDTILFYSMSDDFVFHPSTRPYTRGYIEERFKHQDKRGIYQTNYLTGPGTRKGESGDAWRGFNPTGAGRHWAIPASLRKFLPAEGKGMSSLKQLEALYEQDLIVFPKKDGGQPMYKQYVGDGMPYQDIWAYQPNTKGVLYNSDECIDEDVKYLENEGEKLPYPTQKPTGLLGRIIKTSSDANAIVLDPFCGCGTTIHAAQKLGRQWIGIDVTYLAINLIKRRLKDAFGEDAQFEEKGQPTDFGSAKALAELDKWQFQQWALSLIDARPRTEGDGKGADRGVDGMLYFYESKDKREKILVQVKGGGVQRNDVATLLGDVNNQKFVGGILITLEKPTKPMREEAADAGRYESKLWHDKDYPKIQILTVEGLLSGKERVEAPPQLNPFAKAQREGKAEKQTEMI